MMIRAAGITGGIYAVVVFLFMLYSRKFEVGRMGYLLPYTGLVVGVYSWYFYGEWAWQTVAALAVVVFVRLITNMGSRKYDTLRA